MDKVDGTALEASRLEQRPRSRHSAPTLELAQSFHLDNGDEGTVRDAVAEYIEGRFDVASCESLGPDDQPKWVQAGPVQHLVTEWLVSGQAPVETSNGGTASDRFSNMSEAGRRAWFGRNADRYLSCDLAIDEFR